MALKNTYIRGTPVSKYIGEIQTALMKAGAIGLQQSFSGGRIVGLAFMIEMKGKPISFQLPINWQKVQQVLKNEGIGKWDDDDYAYRVSWAIMKDWVLAQVAILATETVTMPQLFLPYAISSDGKTLYDKVVESNFLLGPGK